MDSQTYIKVGSGQVKKYKIGSKAATLDMATRAGLNVPRGVVVLDAVIDVAVLRGLLVVIGNQLAIPNAEAFVQFLGLPKFDKPVAVRSAFSIEDRPEDTHAGLFKTVLHVDASKPRQLANALCQVWMSVTQYRQDLLGDANQTGEFPLIRPFRRDVLIMEMVEAQTAGVAFTELEYEDDLVNFTNGTGDKLVSGEVAGESVMLPKLRWWENPTIAEAQKSWKVRLQFLMRDVRRWLGNEDWDIEWADDGVKCWLLQARPVSRRTRRNEVFTIANHKENLPALPSRLMTSVIESCAKELFAYYLHYDKHLPSTRPFIEVFAGRPYINLSLMMDMMRIFGLPTRLITDSIGGESERQFGMNLRRVIAKSLRFKLPRLAFAQLLAAGSVQQAVKSVHQRTQMPPENFDDLVNLLRWMYTALVTEMFSLTAAIAPMLFLLRKVGVLDEHAARHQSVMTHMYLDLDHLRTQIAKQPELFAGIEHGLMWETFLQKYGHRGQFEADIAYPRYREDPRLLLQSLNQKAHHPQNPPRRTLKGLLTAPLWWQARRTIQAREEWRDQWLVGFERVRNAFIQRAAEFVEREILPSVDALWMLTIEEVRKLEQGWTPDAAFFEQREREIVHLSGYDLPDLLYRFDDLEQFRDGYQHLEGIERLAGISLTRGNVEGRAWVLDEPAAVLPEGFEADNTILVVRSVNAGWIPTFGLVAGVIVETGGDLSHGSIVLREIGLPAVTNVSKVTQVVQTGDMLVLRAGAGVVECIVDAEAPDKTAKPPEKPAEKVD